MAKILTLPRLPVRLSPCPTMGSHPKWDTGSGVGWLSPCPETGVTPWWDTNWAVIG